MTVDESEQIPAVLDCQAEQSLRMGAGTLLQLDRGDNDHCCRHLPVSGALGTILDIYGLVICPSQVKQHPQMPDQLKQKIEATWEKHCSGSDKEDRSMAITC